MRGIGRKWRRRRR
jgi:hypothetical protein